MKTILCAAVLIQAVKITCQEPPRQPVPLYHVKPVLQKCLKACADPMCASTIMTAECAHGACQTSWPVSCAVGACISSAFIAYATECDEAPYNFYSTQGLALLKKGFFTVFPCMEQRLSSIKKQK